MPWGRVAIAWLIVAALLLLLSWQRLAEWRFPDPDDTLRIVQVRDLLAGQPWFDLHQYRINPGDSAVMHWSRLVDIPLVVLITLLGPMLGPTLAEQVAVILVPLLTLAAIMAVIGGMAHRLFGKEIAGFACLACGLSPIMIGQLQPLRIDHHGWQIFAVIAATAALIHRKQSVGGALAGIAMAIGLLISIEVLPLAAAFAGVMLLRWLRDSEQRWRLVAYLLALAGGLLVVFALTRGLGDLGQYCDVVSPSHLLFFAIVSLSALGTAAWRGLPPLAVVGLLGLGGGIALAAFVWQAPQCLSGPFGDLDPLVRQYWYANVYEGRPFWIQPLDRALPIILQAVVALGATLFIWRESTGATRAWWFDYILLLGAALLGGLLVWRSMAFAGVLSALPTGWLMHRLILRFRSASTPFARIGVVVGAICALVPFSPVHAVHMALAPAKSGTVSTIGLSSCDLSESVALLDRLDPATIFTPIDIGPSVLERTRHSVVATGHHRSQLAMRDVILAYTSADALAHSIVSRHRAQYLVVCTDLVEPQMYAHEAPQGLMMRLLQGKAPAWLQEVPFDAPATFKVWRVIG